MIDLHIRIGDKITCSDTVGYADWWVVRMSRLMKKHKHHFRYPKYQGFPEPIPQMNFVFLLSREERRNPLSIPQGLWIKFENKSNEFQYPNKGEVT
jgi:hypothetical protein